MSAATKKCSKCKTEKPLGEFHMSKTHKQGRQSRCKVCNIAGAHGEVEKSVRPPEAIIVQLPEFHEPTLTESLIYFFKQLFKR